MSSKRYPDEFKIEAVKQVVELGYPVAQVAKCLGITTHSLYAWKKKYSGMEVSHLKRLKELEAENRRLKQMYADAALDIVMLKDVLSKKF